MDRTPSGPTTPSQSGPGSNCKERVLRIPQISSITEATPSDCLMLYPEHSLEEFYSSAEMQSVYSTASTDWAKKNWSYTEKNRRKWVSMKNSVRNV